MTEIKFLESCGQSLLDQNGLDSFTFFLRCCRVDSPSMSPSFNVSYGLHVHGIQKTHEIENRRNRSNRRQAQKRKRITVNSLIMAIVLIITL